MTASPSFYFDEMLPEAVAKGLRARDYQVIMAKDVDMVEKDDLTEHLQYATENELVVVTCDRKFAGLAAQQFDHKGLICWTGRPDDIGGMVRALSHFASTRLADEAEGQVFWLK